MRRNIVFLNLIFFFFLNTLCAFDYINVLIAYTPAAEPGLSVSAFIDKTNETLAASNSSVRLKLVHSYKTEYIEQPKFSQKLPMDTDLDHFASKSDPYMNEVHGLRRFYGADICVLIVEPYSSWDGQTFKIWAENANEAFVIVDKSSAQLNILAHEIGHVIGGRHDVGTEPDVISRDYRHGFVNEGNNWVTALAPINYRRDDGYSGIGADGHPHYSDGGVLNGWYGDSRANMVQFIEEEKNNIMNFVVPLDVSILGDTNVVRRGYITLTASVSGGESPYYYQWYHMHTDDGGINPLFKDLEGPITMAAPVGTWNPITYDHDNELRWYMSGSSAFKVTVVDKDSLGGFSNIHYVTFGIIFPPDDSYEFLSLENALSEETVEYSIENYPNPFNPSTTIKFGLPEAQNVSIEVYNTLGERVRSLLNESRGPGYHEVEWNGKDAAGRSVSSGMYLYVLKTDSKRIVKKMFLMK